MSTVVHVRADEVCLSDLLLIAGGAGVDLPFTVVAVVLDDEMNPVGPLVLIEDEAGRTHPHAPGELVRVLRTPRNPF